MAMNGVAMRDQDTSPREGRYGKSSSSRETASPSNTHRRPPNRLGAMASDIVNEVAG
jgi:hypothetical protein